MKNSLVIVGKDIVINNLFVDYIKESVHKNFDTLEDIYFLEKQNKDLFLQLDDIIFKNDDILIYCEKRSFNTVNKIISTITQDNLEVKKNGMLIPSKSILFEQDTYMVEYGKKRINVLSVEEGKTLPSLLIRSKEEVKYFYILNMDKDSSNILLSPLSQNYDVSLTSSEIVEGLTKIRAKSNKFGQLNSFLESAKSLFPKKIIVTENPISYCLNKLEENEFKISFAESCTGGYLSSLFIRESGASNIIDANVVSYSNSIKEGWLGVEHDILERYGAVSEFCVQQMAKGVANITNSDFSIAISGIAGPTGGSKAKPVGTVYIALKNDKEEIKTHRLNLKGSRVYIQKQASFYAVKMLLEEVVQF